MLKIEGEVRNPRALRFEDLKALPKQVPDVGARLPGKPGGAVELGALLELVKVEEVAAFATLASADGTFAVSVPLAAIRDNALVVYRLGDAPLPPDKGGPVRFYVLQPREGADACANVKALGTIRLTRSRAPEIGHSH